MSGDCSLDGFHGAVNVSTPSALVARGSLTLTVSFPLNRLRAREGPAHGGSGRGQPVGAEGSCFQNLSRPQPVRGTGGPRFLSTTVGLALFTRRYLVAATRSPQRLPYKNS